MGRTNTWKKCLQLRQGKSFWEIRSALIIGADRFANLNDFEPQNYEKKRIYFFWVCNICNCVQLPKTPQAKVTHLSEMFHSPASLQASLNALSILKDVFMLKIKNRDWRTCPVISGAEFTPAPRPLLSGSDGKKSLPAIPGGIETWVQSLESGRSYGEGVATVKYFGESWTEEPGLVSCKPSWS